MSPRFRCRRIHLIAVIAAGLGVTVATADRADGYTLVGLKWPINVVTVKVNDPYLRVPVLKAMSEWNRSGMRMRLKLVRRGPVDVTVRRLPAKPGAPCGSKNRTAGAATKGAVLKAWIALDRNCSKEFLVHVAAHELGHVLGLGHEERRCSVMSATTSINCNAPHQGDLLPWEYMCRPLFPDDVRGAIRRYGGRMNKPPANRVCSTQPTPPPARSVTAEANPQNSFAATRVTWNNPTSAALTQVAVARTANDCATYPPIPGTPTRPISPLYHPTSVAIVPASGGTQSVRETSAVPAGRWCYTVWTVGATGTWQYAASEVLTHPGSTPPDGRLNPSIELRPTQGVNARVTWRNPADIAVSVATVERSGGACPADAQNFRASSMAAGPTSPGPVSFDDSRNVAVPSCYRITVTDAEGITAKALVPVA